MDKIDVLIKCLPDAPFKDMLVEEIGKKDAEIERLNALVEMLRGALEMALMDINSNEWIDVAKEALSATAETVSAWQSKRDNEIRDKAIKKEREECAQLAEAHFIHGHSIAGPHFAAELAKRIRAKGE